MLNRCNVKFDQSQYSEKKKRNIQKTPYKIVPVPNLRDDFYLNLIDWGQNNNIAVGLHNSIYVWSACSSKVQKVYESEDSQDYICSVAFGKGTPFLAFGNTEG